MMGMLVSDLVDYFVVFAVFAVFDCGIQHWRNGGAGRIRRGIGSVFAVLARNSVFNTAVLPPTYVLVFGIAVPLCNCHLIAS